MEQGFQSFFLSSVANPVLSIVANSCPFFVSSLFWTFFCSSGRVALPDAGLGSREVAGGLQVVGNYLIFVEADAAGVSAHETLIKDASRQLIEFILFQRLQHAGANFGGGGNLLQRDVALFALLFQFFTKGRQPSLSLSLGERNFTLRRSKIVENWGFVL